MLQLPIKAVDRVYLLRKLVRIYRLWAEDNRRPGPAATINSDAEESGQAQVELHLTIASSFAVVASQPMQSTVRDVVISAAGRDKTRTSIDGFARRSQFWQ